MESYVADFRDVVLGAAHFYPALSERARCEHGANRDCGKGFDEHADIGLPPWPDSADCHRNFELDPSPMPTQCL